MCAYASHYHSNMESGKRDPQDGTKLVCVLAQIGKVLALYFIEYNLLTAAAVITILPILVIFIVLQRWVVQAVVMSGLKG